MASLIVYMLCAILPYVIWNLQSWFKNYLEARKTGFPILITPANTSNILWMLFSIPLRSFMSRTLPSSLFGRLDPAIYGWEYKSRWRIFERIGSGAFILVTPGKNELMVADPEIMHAIYSRRNDFGQSEIGNSMPGSPFSSTSSNHISEIMGLFGPNLNTVGGSA